MGLSSPSVIVGLTNLTVCPGENEMGRCKLKHSVVQTQSKPSYCSSISHSNGGEVSGYRLAHASAGAVPQTPSVGRTQREGTCERHGQGGHPRGGQPGGVDELKFQLKTNFDNEPTCYGGNSKGFVAGKQEFKSSLPLSSCDFK